MSTKRQHDDGSDDDGSDDDGSDYDGDGRRPSKRQRVHDAADDDQPPSNAIMSKRQHDGSDGDGRRPSKRQRVHDDQPPSNAPASALPARVMQLLSITRTHKPACRAYTRAAEQLMGLLPDMSGQDATVVMAALVTGHLNYLHARSQVQRHQSELPLLKLVLTQQAMARQHRHHLHQLSQLLALMNLPPSAAAADDMDLLPDTSRFE